MYILSFKIWKIFGGNTFTSNPISVKNFTNFKTITALEHNESFTRDKIKLGVTAVILARLHSKRLNQKAIKEINNCWNR